MRFVSLFSYLYRLCKSLFTSFEVCKSLFISFEVCKSLFISSKDMKIVSYLYKI